MNEYLVKGFTMDDERLKNSPGKGQRDYFDEQLERIRDIRSSERRFYQKVLDREELGTLNRIGNACIEFAELRALQRRVMTMRDRIMKWAPSPPALSRMERETL